MQSRRKIGAPRGGDLDSDDSMQVIGKDREGRRVKFITAFYVDDTDYPTQMIVIDKMGEVSTFGRDPSRSNVLHAGGPSRCTIGRNPRVLASLSGT
jgi:hypothetical protein